MSRELDGQVAVVTGAASGIGRAVAQRLAADGAHIVGVDLSDQLAQVLAELPGAGHLSIRADISDPHAAAEAIDMAVRTSGAPRILVNSAGIGLVAPGAELPFDMWQRTMSVNLTGSFLMAQAAGRVMVDKGYGRIVNLASQAAELGLLEHAAYSASKAGILGFTRVLAVEWAPHGVTVNAVSPTVVATDLGRAVWAGEKGDRARAEIPTGRFAEPQEVAALVAFLVGPSAGMITGENLRIDGGRSIV